MSLLRGGPDRVEFFPTVMVEDEYGDMVPGGVSDSPIVLHVELQRLTSDEVEALGEPGARVLMRFTTATDLPADSDAQVVARGRRWSVVGEPTTQGRSRRTRHTRVVIRALDGQS